MNIDDIDFSSDDNGETNEETLWGADDEAPAESWEDAVDEKPAEIEPEKPKVEQPKPEKKEEPKPRKKEEPKPQKKEEPKSKGKQNAQKDANKKKEEPPEQPSNVDPKLRSPICVIMGHVDTGKTKLLDKIRKTNVQDREEGGITQQIGATYFPSTTLQKMTEYFHNKNQLEYKLPGLLIIDTPGHESFTNLRSRGSSLCDIAILVVDIMHGIEPQTIESINLLKEKRSAFIIALNKIDRISDWRPHPNQPFPETFKRQSQHCKDIFKKRIEKVQVEFQEQGLNAEPYFRMRFGVKDKITSYPIVPTSAITGEGIPDLLMLVQLLTQNKMTRKLTTSDQLQCTVLEVKVEEGIGTTLDVILVNGELHVDDTIVIAGIDGPIVTHIRALLTPQPLKELRVKGEWLHHDVIYAAMGCKIAAPGLEGAIAGSELFVSKTGSQDEIDDLMEKVNMDVQSVFNQVDKTGEGVLVQASTLGSLEALLSYLKDKNVKVSHVGIGPVHRKDVIQISSMVEKNPNYAVILAFDVSITPEAQQFADEVKVKIFPAKIIYHLTDMYEEYLDNLAREKRENARQKAVFPVSLEVLPDMIFNRSKPIIMGVRVTAGKLIKGTPISVIVDKKPIYLGTVDTIKKDNVDTNVAQTGAEVSISIRSQADGSLVAGKDFKPGDEIVSRLNRELIDILKEHFRDELTKNDWQLVIKIKRLLRISN
ncbi:eukaryotic translation initiation factor 5B [Histomonas meleagridis]|uniref:eukaryotic translation initiation factor 5B n=1 Tax=Histomonas meleagridis TaxID=135588 RepID=UPI00355A502F|nr:eukaryotic translation initiation factor 5B [Histomonas meleagridis]KAH0806939.1 eukaryotic translation initiation factor 5B [Histomonas meleagridis]